MDSIVREQLGDYFSRLYHSGRFNGNVLVARHGVPVFTGSYGYADYRGKVPLESGTSFQLASVTKQFTAVAILMLSERGLFSLDDPVEHFFPGFPYPGITIRMLLGHRSGLPNYTYFLDKQVKDKVTPVSNDFVIRMMNRLKPPKYYEPDRRFNYSNTGYVLLASVIEKVSGLSYAEFLGREIFEPLGMKQSFVGRPGDTSLQVAKGYQGRWSEVANTFLDGVVGDKGVYSSVTDLFLWDQGLYSGLIIRPSTLEEAFRPYGKPLNSRRNYGLGWRMEWLPDSTLVHYHTGWWHGFQTLLIRSMKDSTTVAVLKNRKSGHIDKMALLRMIYPESFPAGSKERTGEGIEEPEEEEGTD